MMAHEYVKAVFSFIETHNTEIDIDTLKTTTVGAVVFFYRHVRCVCKEWGPAYTFSVVKDLFWKFWTYRTHHNPIVNELILFLTSPELKELEILFPGFVDG